MTHRLITLVSVLIAIVSLSLWAVEKHTDHTPAMDHSAMMQHDATKLREGGQATFAALIETVAVLEQDANTDWSMVDIDGLHAHLLDMNHLMLDTKATSAIIGDTQIRFDIRGTDASIASIHRMVPAHSGFVARSRGWEVEPELTEDGATLTISVKDAASLSKLNALGFYGFMSLDSHHQAHHYQMALGNSH